MVSFVLLLHSISCLFFFWQPNLYPTVGLQTPGEVVDANFGQNPFVYDIEEVMKVCIKYARNVEETVYALKSNVI